MKKTFILLSLAAATFFSCVKPELDAPAVDVEAVYNTTITAAMPDTKVSIADNNKTLTWNNGDKISVLTSAGVYKDFVYDGEDGATTAAFKGNLDEGETVGEYAIYPANSGHKYNEGAPVVNLSAEYDWNAGEVKGPMVATISEETASFAHAGGLFAFDARNIPAGTKGFVFSTSKLAVTGEFACGEENVISAVASDEGSKVTFNFGALTESANMKFYIPVPTGTFEDFTISYIASDNSVNEIRTSASKNVINAATVKLFTVKVLNDAFYVTEDGLAEADGLGWNSATTLDNALNMAVDGDVIHVAAGTYYPGTFISGKVISDANVVADEITTATEDVHKAFIINKNITLLGGFKKGEDKADPVKNETILSGNGVSNHVVIVSAPKASDKQVKISGFTISGATSNNVNGGWNINGNILDNYTGSMAVVGTSLSLENMTFTGNNTVNASGIYGANSKIDIKNCTFTENAASGNGTVWFTDGSELTFSNSEISKNSASNASGLYLYVSPGQSMTARVSDVAITKNTSTTRGAVYLRAATAGQTLDAVLDGLTITDNEGATGAGIYILNASGMTIQNTEMSDNDGNGTSEGGAFYSLDATNTFKNCTFENNTASGNGTFLIQSNAVATLNAFDGCEWTDNVTTGFANMYIYGKATDNNVVITNSLFKNNSVNNGRGGALYVRATNANGRVDCKCVNTTFYGNKATSHGTAVLSYSANDSYITNVDLISCTITNQSTSAAAYAVAAEGHATSGGAPTLNLHNSLIVNNIGINGSGSTLDTYNVGKVQKGVITRYKCQNGTTYYNAEGKNAGTNTFDYATMLGALTEDGVCPLLLPESNPAMTGGMTPAELSALASTNVPAAVLTKDQLGNERTGNIIGAWAGTTTAAEH